MRMHAHRDIRRRVNRDSSESACTSDAAAGRSSPLTLVALLHTPSQTLRQASILTSAPGGPGGLRVSERRVRGHSRMPSRPCAKRGRKESLGQPPSGRRPLGRAAPRAPRARGRQDRPSRNRPKLGRQARVGTLIPPRRAAPAESRPPRCFLGARIDGSDAHLHGLTTRARGGARASATRARTPQSRRASSLSADARGCCQFTNNDDASP